jgi:hypothetical protein
MSGLFRTVCKFFAMFGLQKYTGSILVTRWRRRSNVTSLLQRLSSVFFSLVIHVSVLSRSVVNLRFFVICNGGLSKSEAKGQDRTNVMSSTDSLIRFCINGLLKIFVSLLCFEKIIMDFLLALGRISPSNKFDDSISHQFRLRCVCIVETGVLTYTESVDHRRKLVLAQRARAPPNFTSVGSGLAEPPPIFWHEKPKFVQLISLIVTTLTRHHGFEVWV